MASSLRTLRDGLAAGVVAHQAAERQKAELEQQIIAGRLAIASDFERPIGDLALSFSGSSESLLVSAKQLSDIAETGISTVNTATDAADAAPRNVENVAQRPNNWRFRSRRSPGRFPNPTRW